MNKHLLVLSGGVGSRFGERYPKQYFKNKDGNTFFLKSISAFEGIIFKSIVIVADSTYHDLISTEISKINLVGNIKFAQPGKERQDSIDSGVKVIEENYEVADGDKIFIQESVRPYVDVNLIDRLINAPQDWLAVSPAVSPYVLFGKKGADSTIKELIKKQDIVELQLPKRYELKFMIENRNKLSKDSSKIIDESEIFTNNGHKIHTIEGSSENIKITFPHHKTFLKINKT